MELKQNIVSSCASMRLAQRLAETWSINGRLRKTKFIYDLATTGKIKFEEEEKFDEDGRVVFKTLLPEHFEKFGQQIDSMISMLNNVYGENWDFHLTPTYSGSRFHYYTLSVKILFPEFTIKNQEDKTHQIRDLIVAFELGINTDTVDFTIYAKWLHGTRATINYAEAFCGYMHSHLRTRRGISYNLCLHASSFCTGDSSTEVNIIREDLFMEGYVEEKFEMYLYMLQTFVEYESIEGAPYIKMSRITNTGEESLTNSEYVESTIIERYSEFKSLLKFEDINYTYVDGKYKILNNSKLQDMYREAILISVSPSEHKYYLVKKRADGRLVGLSESSNREIGTNLKDDNGVPAYTMIQGRKIEFKIDGEPVKIDVGSYILHPNLDDYARKQMEQQLYEKGVKRNVFKRQYQSSIV